MSRLVQHMFTGKDNKTWDIGRVLWFGFSVIFAGLTVVALCKGHQFDPQAFGIGAASLLGGGGAGVGLKANAEPPSSPEPD